MNRVAKLVLVLLVVLIGSALGSVASTVWQVVMYSTVPASASSIDSTIHPVYCVDPVTHAPTSCGSGSAVPGSSGFFTSPDNITPSGVGNIWYVDCAKGNSVCSAPGVPFACCTNALAGTCLAGNDGKSPAHPFGMIADAVAAAGNLTNDVIVLEPTAEVQACAVVAPLVISQGELSIMCAEPAPPLSPAVGNVCEIYPSSGTGPTIQVTGEYVHLYGVTVEHNADDAAIYVGGVADGSGNVCLSGTHCVTGFILSNGFLYGAFDGVGPAIELADTADAGPDDAAILSTTLIGGGVKLSGTTHNTYRFRFANDWFSECDGMACISTGAGTKFNNILVSDSHFEDLNYVNYTTLSSGSGTNVLFSNDSFNSTTLTTTQLGLPVSGSCQNCSPGGAVGSAVTVNKVITSSAVLSASPTNILTASGDVFVNKIVGMTDGTGLAGCTNYVIKQDRAIGGTTVASQAITALGASVTFDFANGATTALLPFSLASGGHIQDQATVGPCTGPGTIQLSVTYTRLTPYASLQ